MIYLFLLIIGFFVGSFLNVLADRIPREETVLVGRSYCEHCKKKLAWYDLIPVFSYVLLKGRCRYCKTKLSIFYPVIEISTGIIFALTYNFVISEHILLSVSYPLFNPMSLIVLLYYLVMVSVFIVIFFTDLRYGIIPDRILIVGLLINLLYLIFINPKFLVVNLVTAVGVLLFFVVVSVLFYILTKKIGFGGGDVKFSFLLGLFLGFPVVFISVYTAFLTGGLISIILILWRKKRFFRDSLPFGPFLILGLFLSLFWGDLIIQEVGKLLGF